MAGLCKPCCAAEESKEVVIGGKGDNAPGVTFNPEQLITQDLGPPKAAQAFEPQVPAVVPIAPAEKLKPSESAAEAPAKIGAVDPVPPQVKSPQLAQNTGRKREFDVSVRKTPGQDLGLDVDYGDKITLKVIRVKPGLISNWNASNPHLEVRPNDRITSVNSVGGTTEKFIGEVHKNDKMVMKVRRDNEIEACIVKDSADQPIGLDIDGMEVKIFKVKEGPIMNYNNGLDKEQSEFALKAGDKVIVVNGERETKDIIEQLKTVKVLNMTVSRQ
jgi:hypothetical protein